MGILEPDASSSSWDALKPSIAIVPCLAVSSGGHRLGYGGGFYDRFFESHKNIYRCGVGMVDQPIDKDFAESFDIAMNCYISPVGYLEFD